MASSNRNWPSMFKSKPTNSTSPNQWHHDLNSPHIPNGRNPFTQGGCDDERSPEPKPRWNPRPEQIRILESIFNSGMVNPPREEIRRIRAQLQEYGQVGDANVFYWFQNRKSRSKHKQRHLQSSKSRQAKTTAPPIGAAGLAAAQASSSSSSDKSSPSCNNSNEKPLSLSPSTFIDVLNSPTASVNQPFLHASNQFLAEPFFFPGQETSNSAALTHGIFFPDLSENLGNCSNVLLGDLMQMNHGHSKKDEDDEKIISYTAATSSPIAADHNVLPSLSTPSPTTHNLQGPGLVEKSTVFINDMCFEVANGVPFNVREAFGDDAVLIQSSGQPVPTNEWGVTQQPLQNGAFYYLLSSAPLRRHQTTELLTWYRLFLTSCAMCWFRVLPIFDSLYISCCHFSTDLEDMRKMNTMEFLMKYDRES